MKSSIDQEVFDIIVIKQGQFQVNSTKLKQVLDKANQYARLAIISVIGDRGCGKSTLMNMLIDYHQSDREKKQWPGDRILQDHYFDNDHSTSVLVKSLQIYSRPIPITDQDEPSKSVAMFLLDTQHVFDFTKQDQVMYDMINYLVHVSSMVIVVSKDNINVI